MVHALKEAWRVLIPGGVLLDLRPVANQRPLEVVAATGVFPIGPLDDRPAILKDRAADEAIARMVAEDWYREEKSGAFPLAYYWDTYVEFIDYVDAEWTDVAIVPEDIRRETARLAQALSETKIRSWLHMIITRYRKTNPSSAD